jgi:hypothetical protein
VAPIVGGVQMMWESMRGTVVKNLLAPPGPSKAYLD